MPNSTQDDEANAYLKALKNAATAKIARETERVMRQVDGIQRKLESLVQSNTGVLGRLQQLRENFAKQMEVLEAIKIEGERGGEP